MKLKTRITIGFITMIIMPIVLSICIIFGVAFYKANEIADHYGVSETSYSSFLHPIEIFSVLTEREYMELKEVIEDNPDMLVDAEYKNHINEQLISKNSYLVTSRIGIVDYIGNDKEYSYVNLNDMSEDCECGCKDCGTNSMDGRFISYNGDVLVKELNYEFSNGTKGAAYIVTDVRHLLPEVRDLIIVIAWSVVLSLSLTAVGLGFWINSGMLRRINKMITATENITQGEYEFQVVPEADDELGRLCQALDSMRLHIKSKEEEKQAVDEANRVLISNISHDLRTPITAIKGYAEGILDGVADTEEKQKKYMKTIYNKANDLNGLINQLTVYSKVDQQHMEYKYQILSVRDYFNDCVEELSFELQEKNITFTYYNYVSDDVLILADVEQITRVFHNIVSNSVKYMDKDEKRISLTVTEVGDSIQTEITDNGKGIGSQDLPHIFERFYRADTARNSATGGSGIGLSIVKKIVEDHGGQIWATSKEGVGTVICFKIKKNRR